MPTSTFSIAAGADDQFVKKSSEAYPPSGSVIRNSASTFFDVIRSFSAGFGDIANGLLKFDTSALPEDAVVTTAALKIWVQSRNNSDARSLTAGWYAWDGTSATDYSETPETDAMAGSPLSGLTNNAVNEFALWNLSGISKTGYTSLRLHISGGTPTGNNNVHFSSFENAGNPEPQLVVTYELAADLVGMVGI